MCLSFAHGDGSDFHFVSVIKGKPAFLKNPSNLGAIFMDLANFSAARLGCT